jgi:hypothetical protein
MREADDSVPFDARQANMAARFDQLYEAHLPREREIDLPDGSSRRIVASDDQAAWIRADFASFQAALDGIEQDAVAGQPAQIDAAALVETGANAYLDAFRRGAERVDARAATMAAIQAEIAQAGRIGDVDSSRMFQLWDRADR